MIPSNPDLLLYGRKIEGHILSVHSYSMSDDNNARVEFHFFAAPINGRRFNIVASALKDPICHSNECQIGSFSSEATILCG